MFSDWKKSVLLCSQILLDRNLKWYSKDGFFLLCALWDFSWEDLNAGVTQTGWNHLGCGVANHLHSPVGSLVLGRLQGWAQVGPLVEPHRVAWTPSQHDGLRVAGLLTWWLRVLRAKVLTNKMDIARPLLSSSWKPHNVTSATFCGLQMGPWGQPRFTGQRGGH